MDTQSTPVAQTTSSQLDSARTIQIMNSRALVTPKDLGRTLKFIVQGNGNFLPKGHKYVVAGEERENAFDRTIYSLQANSSLRIAASKHLFAEGLKAESAGDMETASQKYNAFLNACQLSFSVIEGPSSARYHRGDRVQADVNIVTGQATGNLAVILERISAIAPEAAQKSTFSVDDLISQEVEA